MVIFKGILRKKQSVSFFIPRNFSELKSKVAEMIPKEVEKIKEFRKTHGSVVVADITIARMYEGFKDMRAIIYETSQVQDDGLLFRGYPLLKCIEHLPKAKNGCQPLPEGLFWLLLTGEFPTNDEAEAISSEWAERASIPVHVASLIRNFPRDLHPLSKLSIAITILSNESKFKKAYSKGIKKNDYWKYVYEDGMDLIAKLPVLVAKIYNNDDRDRKGDRNIDLTKDWSSNLANMMGFEDPEFIDFLRLYMTLHSDHDGGNVTTHTISLVASALSDPYLSFAAGLNGLAGPLNGQMHEYAFEFLIKIQKDLGNDIKDETLREYLRAIVKEGKPIPGFGHVLLRTTDTRYVGLRNFAIKHFPDDPLFQLSSQLFKVVPGILLVSGESRMPWPSIESLSGVLFSHYGLKETKYYVVMGGISRALGSLAGLVWSRALGMPIERPKSFSTDFLLKSLNVSENV